MPPTVRAQSGVTLRTGGLEGIDGADAATQARRRIVSEAMSHPTNVGAAQAGASGNTSTGGSGLGGCGGSGIGAGGASGTAPTAGSPALVPPSPFALLHLAQLGCLGGGGGGANVHSQGGGGPTSVRNGGGGGGGGGIVVWCRELAVSPALQADGGVGSTDGADGGAGVTHLVDLGG